MADADRINQLCRLLEADHLAHDYGGGGDVRETTLVQAGVPDGCKLVPITLGSARKQPVMYYPPPTRRSGRRSYQLDKARGLDYMYALMRKGQVRLPRWADCQSLAMDFRNNALETHETPRGSPYILYQQRKGATNDVAMAALFGLFSGWFRMGAIPNLSGDLSDEEIEDMENP
jgi:hypothetical protein